jgi:hypothetical protein
MEHDKIFLSVHCVACGNEVELNRIVRVRDSETYYFSCGHKARVKAIHEPKTVKENQGDYIRGLKRKLIKSFRWKISRRTERPTKEILEFDRQRGLKMHIVEERNQLGKWELVHYEEEPFRAREKHTS